MRTGDQAHQRVPRLAGRELRLRIVEAEYGRRLGWSVEVGGRAVAMLTDPEYADMFWEEYVCEPVAGAGFGASELAGREFWFRKDLVFRSHELGLVAPFAFANPTAKRGRVVARGLYLVAELSALDRLLLLARRLRARGFRPPREGP